MRYNTNLFTIAAVVLSGGAAVAGPVTAIDAKLRIDDMNDGIDISFVGGPEHELRLRYNGVSVKSIFGWSATVGDPGDGSNTETMNTFDGERFVLTRLASGDTVGAGTFVSETSGAAAAGYEDFMAPSMGGPWIDQATGLFGFSFEIAGETHYGYGEIQIDNTADSSAGDLLLFRIVYETDADTDITAVGSCPADFNNDSLLNFNDVVDFLTAFGMMDPSANIDTSNPAINFNDVVAYLNLFAAGCP